MTATWTGRSAQDLRTETDTLASVFPTLVTGWAATMAPKSMWWFTMAGENRPRGPFKTRQGAKDRVERLLREAKP